MHPDVLVRFMKAWISKDARNNIFLTEFIKLKNEKDRLSRTNQEFEHKKTVANDPEPEDQSLSDFLCNINDFNTNKMKHSNNLQKQFVQFYDILHNIFLVISIQKIFIQL